MNRSRFPFIAAVSVFIGLASFCLPGCGTSQPPRIYTLSSMATPIQSAPPDWRDTEVLVGIGPLEIPDYLDQAQIVTRTGNNQLSIAEFDLWGGSFKEDVSRVLLENLTVLLKPADMMVLFWKSYVPCSLRVPITIHRLDAVPGGSVTLSARWAVLGKDLQTFSPIRQTVLTRPVKGNDAKDVVAAMSDALETLSKDIASDVKRAREQERAAKKAGK